MNHLERVATFLFLINSLLVVSQQIQLNEVVSSNSIYFDEDGDTPDWIELHNSGITAVSLKNWKLSDNIDNLSKWEIPDISLPPNGYLLIWASGKDKTENSFARTFINQGDSYTYLIPESEPSSQWTKLGFNDALWLNGASGFGYADGDDTTIVPPGTKSVYTRKKFHIANIDNISSLILDIDYDDGFVAYLNGNEVARANINGSPPAFDTGTLTDHEAQMYSGGKPDRFVIDESYLVEGENVLAIQIHNISSSSSDLTLIPFLTAIFTSPETQGVEPPEILGLTDNELHANFKISSTSETIYLSNSGGDLVDELLVEDLQPNTSKGRSVRDNSLVFFNETTPGYQNSTTEFSGIISNEVIFSHPGGSVPSSTLSISLTGNTSGQTIRYTTDATIPTESSQVYSTPITISSNTVIRARIFQNNFIPTTSSSRTYLFNTNHQIDMMNLVSDPNNFFSQDNGIYVFGNSYDPNVPYFGANFWEDWERPVHVTFYENKTGNIGTAFNAGIKIFGGWSRGQNDQRSLAIFARGEYGTSEINYPLFNTVNYQKFQALVLRNSGQDWLKSSIKDITLTSLMEGSGLDFQSYRPVATYINDEYWGMYNMREKVNEHMLASKHNIDADDIILLEGNGQVIEGSNESYLELIEYISNTDLTSDENFKYVSDRIDIKNYALYQATQIFINNTDWPGNNIKFWTHPEGKWRWVLYDTDFAFGPFWDVANYNQNTLDFALEANGPDWPNPPWSTLLFRKLLENLNFRNSFINRYADELNTRFLPEKVKAHIESVFQSVLPELNAHYTRWGASYDDALYYMEAMKTFAENRPAIVKDHIKNRFSLPNIYNITIVNNDISEGYVEVNDNLKIQSPNWNGDYFESVPITLEAIPEIGFEFSHWSGSVSSTSTTIEIDMQSNMSVIPNFTPTTAVHPLVINEINYNSSDDADTGDWVELYNPNTISIDVSNWVVKDNDDSHLFVIPSGTTIDAQGFLVLVRSTADFSTVFPNLTNIVGDFTFGLGSTSDAVRLYNANSVLQDEVYYSSEFPWSDCAKGNGQTLELISPGLDNSLSDSWDCINQNGSPGQANERSLSTIASETPKIKIYPNPVRDKLYISGSYSNNISINIYSLLGKKVMTTNTSTIDVGFLRQGVYFVRVSIDNKTISQKLIKL